MSRTKIALSVSVALLLCIHTAQAAMTEVQAKALAVAAYQHPKSRPGAAAFEQLKHAAIAGAPAAQYWIGVLWNSRQRYAKANYWLTEAAEQGVAGAQNFLGVDYENGKGVSKNYGRADYWYRKSAEQGDADAQLNLAAAYTSGEGVPTDYAQALYWFKKAAQQGSAIAQFNVGVAYDYGRGVPENHLEAVNWYRKAAVQGDADAQNNLGADYANGEGVPKSYAKAVYWYKKAAAGGNRRAKNNLAAVLAQEAAAKEQASSPLKLFGVGLKGATRASLEPALTKAGLTPHNGQVGSKWWWDKYDVHGQLAGASELGVGYTQNSRFAMAEYVFPSSMDTGQVRQVINLVITKYGQPSSVNGDFDLGPVTAVWNVGDGMDVKVRRGWPNTTTYLDLIDVAARATMNRQFALQRQQEQARKAKAQSNAF